MDTDTLTITQFQRQFKKAREEVDKGFTVFIRGNGKRYVFMEDLPDTNPFEGLEHIFGKAKRLSSLKQNARARRHN